MLRPFAGAALAAALGLVLAAPAMAQQAPPAASKDPAAAPAGAYKLDPRHTTVEARVAHMNTISYSTFRFGAPSGTLAWDPAHVDASKLDVSVQMTGVMTPVAGFAEEISGPMFLNAAKFPDAHFVSTSIRRTGPTTGQIMGQMTFMGQTHPMTFDASFVGTGHEGKDTTAIGFMAKGAFKRSDYGFTAGIPGISDRIELVIDTEFDLAK